MDFALTGEQEALRQSVARICARFPDAWWRARDADGAFPHEFHRAMAEAGFLGICMPEEIGGSGLGITEAAIMMQEVAASGAAMSGASAIHMNIFGLMPVVAFGTPEQRARMLPPLIRGEEKACFAVTEPDAGLDTTRIATRAERRGGHYVLHGQKVWTSTAQVADRMLILARTTPLEQVARRTEGLSLFYAPLDRRRVEVREIPKMGRHAVDSNMLFLDGLEVAEADRIGEEGQGFRCLLHGLNAERILVAAEAVGIGLAAIGRAARHARERVVFGRPIGANQGVQHPLAERWMQLEAARLVTMMAAWKHDRGLDCGAEANSAKYLAGEAGFQAAQTAVMTLGGYGYAKEYDVERLFRESLIPRIAPVSPQLILCHIAERVLGLPRSY